MAEKEKIAPQIKSSPYDHQLFGEGESSHDKCCCTWPIPKRFIVSILAFLGFANVYALRVNLSVAMVAMVSNHTVYQNGSWIEIPAEFTWGTELQGIILGSFFYGYIFTQLPGGLLAVKFGGKNLLGFGVFCTAVLSLFIPVIARANVGLLIVLRILIGLCEGVVYPANHYVWSKWAPPLERSKLSTIAVSGSFAGTVIAMSASGVLAKSLGWPSIFYVFGCAGILWSGFWFLIVKNSPSEDPKISTEERNYILNSLRDNGITNDKTAPIPWKSIFTSLPVWAIIVAHFSENWGFYTLLTELPSYLKNRLKFNLERAGFVSAMPYLVMTVFVQLAGQFADCLRRKKVLTTTQTRKVFNSIGFVSQCVCLVAAGYTNNWIGVVISLTFATGLGGFAFSGFFVNHLDIAPQYASVLLGITNTVATLPGIFSPLLTGFIVKHNSAVEWRIVFYLGGAIYAAGAIFYVVFASGDVQPWAKQANVYEEVLLGASKPEDEEDEEEELHR